jgi:putative membrane protein
MRVSFTKNMNSDGTNRNEEESLPLLRASGKSTDSLLYSVAGDDSRFLFGSTASDHLANERTYLGWIFFSVFMIGISFSLLKGGDPTSVVEGYLAVLIGLVALLSSTQRYFRVMRLLEQGQFEPNVTSVMFVVVVVVASAAISFSFYFLERDSI